MISRGPCPRASCPSAAHDRGAVRRHAGGSAPARCQATTTVGNVPHHVAASEEERLQFQCRTPTDPDIREELPFAGLGQRADGHRPRLQQSLITLLARLESGTLGLERLVAQLAEILALSETATSPVEGAKQLEALADELEGLRAGLAETEQLSRRASAPTGAKASHAASDDRGARPMRDCSNVEGPSTLWAYLGAMLSGKVEEKADPKIQIEQAIEEAKSDTSPSRSRPPPWSATRSSSNSNSPRDRGGREAAGLRASGTADGRPGEALGRRRPARTFETPRSPSR